MTRLLCGATALLGILSLDARAYHPDPLAIIYGGTGSAAQFTQGSILFSGLNGVYSQDNSNFFWDDSNVRLGIGTPTPTVSIDTTGLIRIRGLTVAGLVTTNSSGNLSSEASATVPQGGTGITSGTSGGVPYFSSTTTIASSALLTGSQLIVGGGAGSAPVTLAAGSQFQPLVMGATTPGYAALSLNQSAAVTGQLPVGNGGTGLSSGTSGGIPYFSSSSTVASSGALTANQVVIGGGAGTAPSALAAGTQFQSLVMGASNPGYSAVSLNQSAAVSGTLPTGNGGLGVASPTAHGVLIGEGASAVAPIGGGSCTTGQLLTCVNSGNSDPAFQSQASAVRCQMAYDSGNGNGAVNTAVVRFSNQRLTTGSCMTFSDSVNSGSSVAINTTGLYSIEFHCGDGNSNTSYGIVITGTLLAGNVRTTTYAQGLRCLNQDGPLDVTSSGGGVPCAWTGLLTGGTDTVYFESNSTGEFTDARCMFTITQVSP